MFNFCPKYYGRNFLQNFGLYLPNYAKFHIGKVAQPKVAQPKEPQISCSFTQNKTEPYLLTLTHTYFL